MVFRVKSREGIRLNIRQKKHITVNALLSLESRQEIFFEKLTARKTGRLSSSFLPGPMEGWVMEGWGHPLKGTSSMKKLPRSRKRYKIFLARLACRFRQVSLRLLAAPDISLVCVGGFFAAPVTHQDQGLRRCVVTFLPATLCAPSANRRSRKSAVPYRVQSFAFKSNGFEPTL